MLQQLAALVQFCKKLKLTWLAGYGHSWEVNVNVNMLYQLAALVQFYTKFKLTWLEEELHLQMGDMPGNIEDKVYI